MVLEWRMVYGDVEIFLYTNPSKISMGLFSKKKQEIVQSIHPSLHHQLVAQSFSHVRKDVQNMYDWIRYLHQQNKAQQEHINHLAGQVQSQVMHKEELDNRTQAHVRELNSRVFEVEKRVSQVHQAQAAHPVQTHELVSKIAEVMGNMRAPSVPYAAPTSSLQEKVIKKVQQHSKDYIKTAIRQLIAKYAKMSGIQLREILVEEQALCSRSSFYRLLGELEDDGLVNVLASGKEKVYTISLEAGAVQLENFK